MLPTTKKKQEDKHVKALRELAALQSNKNCFDCGQRGPTYVNMTIGSFICVTCSGKLRGLNPPHRVKSISMATFTSEEVDFLKSKGNEACHPVWLGTYDSRRNMQPDCKDDIKMVDFLIAKYEKKSWYVEPSSVPRSATPSFVNSSSQLSSPSSVSSSDSRSIGSASSQYQTNRSATPRPTAAKAADLLSGLSLSAPPSDVKTSSQSKSRPSSGIFSASQSPWSAAPSATQPVSQTFSQPSFAQFENFADFDSNPVFPAFETPSPAPTPARAVVNGGSSPTKPKATPPSEDRYAALKDLDLLSGSLVNNNNEPAKVEEWGVPKGVSRLSNGTNRQSWAGSIGGLNIFDAKSSVFDSATAWGTPPKAHIPFSSSMSSNMSMSSKELRGFNASPNPFAGFGAGMSTTPVPVLQHNPAAGATQNPFSSSSPGVFGRSPAGQTFMNGNFGGDRQMAQVGQQTWTNYGSPSNGLFSQAQPASNLFSSGISPHNPFMVTPKPKCRRVSTLSTTQSNSKNSSHVQNEITGPALARLGYASDLLVYGNTSPPLELSFSGKAVGQLSA